MPVHPTSMPVHRMLMLLHDSQKACQTVNRCIGIDPQLSTMPNGVIPGAMTTPAAITLLAWDRLLGAGARALRTARTELKRAGLPPLEWYDILVALDRRGPLRPRDLQRVLNIAQYNLSRLLTRMERAGLVTVAPCPGDGRGQIVALTDAGIACRAAMWPAYAAAIEGAMTARLEPDERIVLAGMLQKVA
jgi:DNA-binding MarR family transcriptional regulator